MLSKMNKLVGRASLVLILSGFVVLWVNGVGVSLGPSSLGLLLLGAGLFLKAFDSRSECQSVGAGLIGVVLVAAVYLVWRAWTGGPEGLAFHDLWLVLILVASYLASSSGGENFAKGVFFSLLALSVVGVYLSFTQVFSADPRIHEVTGEVAPINATGFFFACNSFASFAVTSFFLVFFGGIIWNRNPIVRVIVCVVLGGLFWGIVASGSRGGWLALVAGGSVCIWGLWAYFRRHQSDRAPIVALAGVVIALLAVVTSWWVVKKQAAARANLEQVAQVDDGHRLEFQKMALDLGFGSPVIGNGARSFSYRVFEHWDLDRLLIWIPNPEFAHNEFLQLFCDYGIVGIILASLAIAAHFIYGIVAIQTEDIRGSACGAALRPAALGGMVAILAQCYFSFLLHIPAIVAMLGLLAGLAGRRGVAPSKLGVKQRVLCCLGGLLAMFLGATVFWGYRKALEVEAVSLISSNPVALPGYGRTINASPALVSGVNPEYASKSINQLVDAGVQMRDGDIVAQGGQLAMVFANAMDQEGDKEGAKRMRIEGINAFERTLELNSNHQIALVGVPQLLMAQSRFEEAEEALKSPMETLWSREVYLRTFFHASLNAYLHGYQLFLEGRWDEGVEKVKLAVERIERSKELLSWVPPGENEIALREQLAAWDKYFRGRQLYLAGDAIWKKRRPEEGMGLMLEAATSYRESQQIVEKILPRWAKEFDRLSKNLEILKVASITPVKYSEEELLEIVSVTLDPALEPTKKKE